MSVGKFSRIQKWYGPYLVFHYASTYQLFQALQDLANKFQDLTLGEMLGLPPNQNQSLFRADRGIHAGVPQGEVFIP